MRSRRDIGALFGDNLKQCRRDSGQSQEELAIGASLHRTEIGMLERGERIARIDTAVRLASALGVSITELVKDIEWAPGSTQSGEFASRHTRRGRSGKADTPCTGSKDTGAGSD